MVRPSALSPGRNGRQRCWAAYWCNLMLPVLLLGPVGSACKGPPLLLLRVGPLVYKLLDASASELDSVPADAAKQGLSRIFRAGHTLAFSGKFDGVVDTARRLQAEILREDPAAVLAIGL
jgi:hypothetical protein